MQNDIAQIAVDGNRLAIFGSLFGFAGPVIQEYTPFADESAAIAEAREKIAALGKELSPEIARPKITRMVFTTRKVRKS